MQPRHLKSDLLFLLSAIIWGFAFVAQRMGMDHVGPFTFNGVRFLLGAMVLLPFIGRKRTTFSTLCLVVHAGHRECA